MFHYSSPHPVATFIDHGPNREIDYGISEHGYTEYQKDVARGHYSHIVAQPGDLLPISGLMG